MEIRRMIHTVVRSAVSRFGRRVPALPRRTPNVRGIAVLSLLVLSVLAGCHSAPDMRPFADATSQLSVSVKAAGRAVGDEITAVTRSWPEDQRARADEIRERFHSHWVQRGRLADALSEYAVSLTEIVSAGERGEASALALATSFGKLCDAVGSALPPAMAGEVVASSAARLYGLFARDRAARTLARGMAEMQPALDVVIGLLDKDLASIERALLVLRVEAGDAPYDHTAPPVAGFLPSNERNNLIQHSASLTTLRAELAEVQERGSIEQLPGDATERRARESYLQGRISASEASIAASVQRLEPIRASIAEAQDRIDTEVNLVQTIRGGLADWASSHGRLAQAAVERKAPRVDELVDTAVQIRDLVRKIRE